MTTHTTALVQLVVEVRTDAAWAPGFTLEHVLREAQQGALNRMGRALADMPDVKVRRIEATHVTISTEAAR